MEKKNLIEALSNLQTEISFKQKVDNICKNVLESVSKPLTEATDEVIVHKLGFPMAIYDKDLLLSSKDRMTNVIRMLGLTLKQFKEIINSKPREDWALAKPKGTVYVSESDFNKGKKTILVYNRPSEADTATTKHLVKFRPAALLTSTHKIDEGTDPIRVAGGNTDTILNLIPIVNDMISQMVVYKLSKAKYMIMMMLRGDNELYTFPMNSVSFHSAFELKG